MAKKSELEVRLEELEALKSKGTITEEEYTARRAALMTSPPEQSAKQGRFPFFRVGCLGLLGVFVVIIAIVVIAAVAGGGDDDDAADSTSGSESATNEAQVGDLHLTVNAVDETYTDDLFPAEPGTHYVTVDITAENTGNSTYALNVLNFHMKDSTDFTNDPATTSGPEPAITHHDMTRGQTVRGFIVFKVKDGATPVELQYQSFTGTPGTISLAP